jgi:competence protein ComEC
MTELAPAGLDLRLAIAAIAAWCAVLWGLGQSSRHVAVVALAAFALAISSALAGRWRGGFHVLALALCTVTVVLAPLAARLHGAHEGELSALAASRTHVIAELVVTSDPRLLAAKGAGGSPRTAVDARITAVSIAGHRTSVRADVLVLGPAEAWRAILPGQRVRFDARLAPPLPDNLLTATLSARTDPELLGEPPWWQRAAGSVRAGLQRASSGLPTLPRGLLPGLVDGDTSQLDPVLAERFRVAGLTHLVAVSGTNCAIVIGAAALMLKRMRASPRVTAVAGAIVLVGFVVIARPSPSVLRAAGMAAIALSALASGRQRSALPVLAASVIGLLLWKPMLASDVGFLLSVAATAALFLIAPGWAAALRRRRVPAGIAEAIAVAAAAHLVTAPIIVGISGTISLVAVPANLLAEPVVAAATVLGVLAALASVVWLPLGSLFAELAGWPCRWLVWIAEYFGSLSGAQLPWPSGIAGGLSLVALCLALLTTLRFAAPRALLGIAIVIALIVQIPVRSVVVGWPPAGWLMVACDVGQGDALVLSDGPASAVVIDAGPDPIAVDRCLHELGIHRIPLLVLTHMHLDHVGGLSGVLHDRQIGQVVTSPLADPASGHRLVVDVLGRRGLQPRAISAGYGLEAGRVHVDVIGPTRSFTGTRSDPNNSSLVLMATAGGRRILLTGDAEVEAQDALLASGVDLHADILKVPHHGSAYSDPVFLQSVHATLALVSVGRDNDYGHPSPLLIAELARLGIPARRTDVDGDIAVVPDGSRLVPVVRATRTGNARRLVGAARGPPSDRHATMASCPRLQRLPPLV